MMFSRLPRGWADAKNPRVVHREFDDWHMAVVKSWKGYFWRIRRIKADVDIDTAEEPYATQLEAIEVVEAELQNMLNPEQRSRF